MESGEVEEEEIGSGISQTLEFTGSESELGVRSLSELSNQVTGKLGARPD